MKWILAAAFAFGISTTASAQKGCDYAGQAFSVGATVCECPSLKAENLNWQRENGVITSRRLVCGQGLTWEDTKTMCIDAQMTTETERTYKELMNHYCPRLPVNFAEIQRAVSQETNKFIDAAPKSLIVSMVEGICKRFRLEAPCKALLEALTAPDGQAK